MSDVAQLTERLLESMNAEGCGISPEIVTEYLSSAFKHPSADVAKRKRGDRATCTDDLQQRFQNCGPRTLGVREALTGSAGKWVNYCFLVEFREKSL